MGIKNKSKNAFKNKNKTGSSQTQKAQTPQPRKEAVKSMKKTPNSMPPLKRKKLSQEIDDQISDDEFESVYQEVKAKEKLKKITGIITPKKPADVEDSDDCFEEDSDDDEDDLGDSDDADDVSDDDESEDGDESDDDGDDVNEEASDDDNDDDEEASDDDESENELENSKMADILKKLTEGGSDESEEDSEDDIQAPKKKLKFQKENVTVKSEPSMKKKSKKEQEKKTDDIKTTKSKKDKKEKSKKGAENGSGDKSDSKPKLDVGNARKERDVRTLFLKNIPNDVQEDSIKAIAKKCTCVRMKKLKNKKLKNRGYAFVEFGDESTTEKYFNILKKAEIQGQKMIVDYVGSKSQLRPFHTSKVPAPEELDPLKLFVSGLTKKATFEKLNLLFPKSTDISIPLQKAKDKQHPIGYAFVEYKSPKLCKAALTRVNGQELDGKTLEVYHAKNKKGYKRPKVEASKVTEAVPSKKAKKAKKVQEVTPDEPSDDDASDDDMDDDGDASDDEMDEDDEAASDDDGSNDDDDESD